MKKIVGILGMAAVLATSAFAAEPTANFVLSSFTGEASLEWKSNLEAETNGFVNTTKAGIKFGFITEGTKATTGDGVWGDLQIKFADGLNWENDNNPAAVSLGGLKAPTVEVAKIHFVDGNFSAALNIKKPTLIYGGFNPASATGIDATGSKVGIDLDAGFALELAMADMFEANVKVMDNTVATKKAWGLAVDASLKAVENLDATVAGTFNFDKEYYGAYMMAGYKFGIPDTKMYVKPAVAFTTGKEGDAKAENSLTAGLLFGWGAEGVKPEFELLNKGNDKFNEGLAVTYFNNFKENTEADYKQGIAIGLFDQSVLSLLDADGTFGTLKTGVQFVTPIGAKEETTISTLNAGVKYDISVSVVDLSAHFDMEQKFQKDVDHELNYKFGFGISSGKVIDNTKLYANYEAGKDDKGTITVGTNIHF